MTLLAAVAFGAFAVAGTLARAIATVGQPAGRLPARTLLVNTIGAFVLGLITTAGWWDHPVALTVGGLGSLTTFSTVVGETATLAENGHKPTAVAYVGLTLAAGVAAAWLGLSIGEQP